MPNRIIKESICVSEQIDQLSPIEEVTFYRLLVNCDDYGCFDARERVVLSRLFPLKDFKPADVRKLLNKLAAVGLIELYQANGRPLLKVCKWSEHQRVRISKHKYPLPEVADSCENSRQVAANCGEPPLESNPIQSEYESESKRENRKRFTPPTVEEVKEYCRERGNNVNAQRFVDFYTSKGWKVGKESMKDWKACVRTWENRDKTPGKVLPAQNFPQRDYSDVDRELTNELAEEIEAMKKGAG